MKKIWSYFYIMLLIPIFTICGCSTLHVDPAFHANQDEMRRATASLHQSRPENASIFPDLTKNITDLRVSAVPRAYDPPSDFEDFQNISLMQIWYGYYADGIWYDHPSENYNLKGIFEFGNHTEWKASIGSHIAKIGPYLLICIALQDDPLVEYHVSDTMSTEVLYPFAEYVTYHYYSDADGNRHFYKDTHDHGYGYLAEDPSALGDSEKAVCIMRCEFPRRYYLILDFASLPEDYVLTVQQTSSLPDKEEIQTLSYNTIMELLQPRK